VALTDRDQAAVSPGDGVDRADGRARFDPAHGGPVVEATFAELIGRLINDLSELADKQIELAKQEVNEAKDQAIGAVKRLAIGAGIAAVAGLLLVIWLWTAVIWFFNWLGAFVTLGPVNLGWLGWPVGLVVPLLLVFIGWKSFVQAGLNQAKTVWPPLPRTRATLKEDLEWVRDQRTRSTR
jgi:Putative Actinobacterial Holin-X, holin superfamily III